MSKIPSISQPYPGRLFYLEKPAVLIETDDQRIASEVADFLKLVHGGGAKLRPAKIEGFWLRLQADINKPSLRVAAWLYQVPVTIPDYC